MKTWKIYQEIYNFELLNEKTHIFEENQKKIQSKTNEMKNDNHNEKWKISFIDLKNYNKLIYACQASFCRLSIQNQQLNHDDTKNQK